MPKLNTNNVWFIEESAFNELNEKIKLASSQPSLFPEIENKDRNNETVCYANYWGSEENPDKKYGVISIQGSLSDKPSWWGSDYRNIARIVEQLEADETIDTIALDLNTPGGMTRGLFECCSVIQKCSKPVYAFVGNMACSAGYALACACKKIYATPASNVGCVGALIAYTDDSEYLKKLGIVEKTIVGKHSDKKAPDYNTPEGQAVLQKRVDRAEEFFIDYLAKARGVTTEDILAKFGHGEVFFAEDTVKDNRGMVDELCADFDEFIDKINPKSLTEEGELRGLMSMTLDELKAQNPSLFEQMKAEVTNEVKAEADKDLQGKVDEQVKAELDRQASIKAFATVENDEVKALVEKAINEKMSANDFYCAVAPKLKDLCNAPQSVANTDESTPKAGVVGDESLKNEAEQTISMTVPQTGVVVEQAEQTEADKIKAEVNKLKFEH